MGCSTAGRPALRSPDSVTRFLAAMERHRVPYEAPPSHPHRMPRPLHRFLIPGLTLVFLACGGDGGTQPDPGGDDGGGPPPTTVSAPSNVALEALSSSRVRLSWADNSTNETGFQVERSPDGVAWNLVAQPLAGATSHEDAGLAKGTRYVYRVRAVVGSATSAWSATTDVTTLADTRGDVLEIERAIADVLPPAGTPILQRNLVLEVRAAGLAIAGLPGVDTVFVLDSLLVVNSLMDDGSVHLFIHNRVPGVDEAFPAPAPARAPLPVRGPPGSARAAVASYDGGAAVAAEVTGLLSGAGYDVLPLGASVDDMRQYSNLGALYVDTHGAAGIRPQRRPDGSLDTSLKLFAIETSSQVQGLGLGAYSQELRDGDIVYSSTQNADGSVTTKLAITESFIAKHWSFDGGIVMIHACYAGRGPFTQGGLDLDPTVLQLATLGAGADVYVSFDNLTWASYARPSILYFWDRLLGANSHEPEDPPARPFPVPDVRQAMADRGLLQFTRPQMAVLGIGFGGNDVNVTFDGGSERTTLAPSIVSFDLVDDVARGAGEMTLTGLFGAQQGTVEIEGGQVPVSSWSEQSIVAQVPFEALGSAGLVVVKTDDDVKSNEVPLTEWRGTLTATTELVGNLKAEAIVDLRFRADVHASRQDLMQGPEHRVVTTSMNPASKGTSRGSGTHTYPDGEQLTLSGAYDLRILSKAEIDGGGVAPGESALGAKITLDPVAGQAEVCVILWGEVDLTSDSGGGPNTQRTVLVYGSAPFLVDGSSLGLFGCATVSMDPDSFVIDQFEKSFTADDATYTIKWDKLQPFAAPNDQTAG